MPGWRRRPHREQRTRQRKEEPSDPLRDSQDGAAHSTARGRVEVEAAPSAYVMDEFEHFHIRYEEAKKENHNAYLSGDTERKKKAFTHYRNLIDEFHYIFETHRERLANADQDRRG